MRVNPLGFKKFVQSELLEYSFGGTELNVSISLSQLGCKTSHVTILPNDFMGDAAKSYISKYGVSIKDILRKNDPIGLYFLEAGAVHRSSKISYNRSHSGFAKIESGCFDWPLILKDCNFFHWSGITPGISREVFLELKKALETAQKKGIPVTADVSYRKGQWNYGLSAKDGLSELLGLSNFLIGGVSEIDEITGDEDNSADFVKKGKLLMEKFPNISTIFEKTRKAINGSFHKIQGRMLENSNYFETEVLELTHIVDRIGTGDAFSAGIVYGLLNFENKAESLRFATAACALKHTIEGDANLVSFEEIKDLMNGNVSGRIKR